MSAAERASRHLVARREALATTVTERLFAEMPELHDKYGAVGWEKCLQDMRYNIEHLTPAVELEKPELFVGYLRWVDEVLRSRGVSTAELRRVMELLAEELRRELDPAGAQAAAGVIESAMAALTQGPA